MRECAFVVAPKGPKGFSRGQASPPGRSAAPGKLRAFIKPRMGRNKHWHPERPEFLAPHPGLGISGGTTRGCRPNTGSPPAKSLCPFRAKKQQHKISLPTN